MLEIRNCLLVVLIIGATSVNAAEDYVIPTGVTVLTEEQLLNKIIGSTLIGGGGQWRAYFIPSSGDQKKGKFKGRSMNGPTSGDWTVNGELMCWYFDQVTLSSYSGCFTTKLDGDTVKWYIPSGHPRYSPGGRMSLISGNSENF